MLQARARIWIDYISKTVVPAFRQLVLAQDPAEQSKALNTVRFSIKVLPALQQSQIPLQYYEALKPYVEQIAPGGPYFLGAKFSLVDATIAPWVVRDFIFTKYRGFERSAAGEAWEKYSQAIETRDSIVNTSSVSPFFPIHLDIGTDTVDTHSRIRNITSRSTLDIYKTDASDERACERAEAGESFDTETLSPLYV